MGLHLGLQDFRRKKDDDFLIPYALIYLSILIVLPILVVFMKILSIFVQNLRNEVKF